ncbi:hypothetical protein [Lysobacter sp. CFH 32150]|uniref:hypothetical protein n=1 Tax=Lysobacter sp. CFH 32150 TaxID=2927128 RepID=UPI001FA73EB7|nr:hypothetical protein [Lysobacter sp. CFH 32150]MCI4567967.1 hypothetical protein [Lysobacter sp. CFH 32150]
MPTSDILIAIAQVAVALAGFSGLVAAIRIAAPDGWHPRDIWSLFWMFGASIGALVLALLPLWLALFGWSEAFVYRASSAVASLYIGMFAWVMVHTGMRLTRGGYPPRIRWFPSTVALLLIVSSVCLAAGAVGGLRASVIPAYVGSLIALLLVSALVLAVFLILLARSAQRK